MPDDRHKKDIVNRLRSVQGHLKAVERMVDEDQYCIDILKQTLAVQGALDRINNLILERHLRNCVTTAIRSQDQSERERVIGELMQLFQGGSHVSWNRHTPAPSAAEILGQSLSSAGAVGPSESDQVTTSGPCCDEGGRHDQICREQTTSAAARRRRWERPFRS